MAPPPALTDDLVGEILLRVPPAEPAHLVRASLVCKSWLRLLSEPTFLRQYREFHRTPPLLGFLHNLFPDGLDFDDELTRFVPTTVASPLSQPDLGCGSLWALDCRHGRVLFDRVSIETLWSMGDLVVWDPITGDHKQFPSPKHPHTFSTGAVLCAVAGCDHLGCCGGPFHVVFVGSGDHGTWASVYSSETGVWSAPTFANVGPKSDIQRRPSNLTGNALYFEMVHGKSILKFDLGERTLSAIELPQVYDQQSSIVMTAEDGKLGFAAMEGKSMHLWSWEDGDEEIAGWMLRRVIELDGLIPIHHILNSRKVIGFVEGTCTIFISTDASVFTLDLKSRKVKKVGEKGWFDIVVLPYTSFYAPEVSCELSIKPISAEPSSKKPALDSPFPQVDRSNTSEVQPLLRMEMIRIKVESIFTSRTAFSDLLEPVSYLCGSVLLNVSHYVAF